MCIRDRGVADLHQLRIMALIHIQHQHLQIQHRVFFLHRIQVRKICLSLMDLINQPPDVYKRHAPRRP